LVKTFGDRLVCVQSKPTLDRERVRAGIDFTSQVGEWHPGGRGRRTDKPPPTPAPPAS
jgi:hypothetical protein